MNANSSHCDTLVFFGATGDLAYKKIFPALQAMVKRGTLNVPVIGAAKARHSPLGKGRIIAHRPPYSTRHETSRLVLCSSLSLGERARVRGNATLDRTQFRPVIGNVQLVESSGKAGAFPGCL